MTGATGRATLARGADYIVVAPRSELRLPAEAQPGGFTRVIQQLGTMLFKVRHTGVPHFAVDTPMLVGETYVLELDELMPYYGTGHDELHLAFNFLFVHAELDAAQMRSIVEVIEAKLPAGAWPVWTGSNHDAGRLVTRWAGGDEAKTRAALLMLLGLRGTAFLYYGDEIGMPDVPLDPALALDPVPHRTGDPSRNRDECRTPMQWSAGPGAGFTAVNTRGAVDAGTRKRVLRIAGRRMAFFEASIFRYRAPVSESVRAHNTRGHVGWVAYAATTAFKAASGVFAGEPSASRSCVHARSCVTISMSQTSG